MKTYKRKMNTYIFTVGVGGLEYSWRVPKKITPSDVVNFLGRIDCLNGAGQIEGETKKDARARIHLLLALDGDNLTAADIDIEEMGAN